ncbi:MAG: hemolysin family protein [Lachnospiraceae bacterium]|nr:hemolysin family protein [Lachnospiraceae bacterium]
MSKIVIIALGIIINDLVLLLAYLIYLLIRHKKNANSDAAEQEIMSIVNESAAGGYIEDDEAQMIGNIFEFGDKAAKDIMTDRGNIIAVDASLKLKDALDFMLDTSNSRFPVYMDDLDRIIGILHLKDAMRLSRIKGNMSKTVGDIDGLIREARFIPETRKVDALFKSMQASMLQMVIVIDEYGQTAGLVAMEDILEEIVGNINDEYDEDGDHIVERGEDKYIIEGITELEALEKRFGIEFDTEDFETINGFLISKMDKIPDKKERFDITVGDYNFKVLEVDHNMIQQILVTKVEKPDSTEDTVLGTQVTDEPEDRDKEEKER